MSITPFPARFCIALVALIPAAAIAQTAVPVQPEVVDYIFSHGRRVQLREIGDEAFYRISGIARLAKVPAIRARVQQFVGFMPAGGAGDELAIGLRQAGAAIVDSAMRRLVNTQEAQHLRAFRSDRTDAVYIEYPEVILQCSPTTTLAQVETYLHRHYQVQVQPTGLGAGQFLVRVMTPSQTLWLANQLQSTTALPVEYAEVNFHIAHPSSLPKAPAPPGAPAAGLSASDPAFPQQWALSNPGTRPGARKGSDIGFSRALRAGPLTAAGIKIALLDFAVDIHHPDLQGVLDLDHAFNATRFNAGMDLSAPELRDLDFRDQPEEFADHGTACAGIIGALSGNHIGISGVAPGVVIIPIQIAVPVAANGFDLVVNGLQMRAALQAAELAGAQIVSFSWGLRTVNDDDIKAVQSQILNMNTSRGGLGILVVSAAGNDSIGFLDPDFPADNFEQAPNLLAAGATNWCGDIKSSGTCDLEPWTTRRNDRTLFAPGVGIFTTTNLHNPLDPNSPQNYRADFNGTSAATPFIAGAAALVMQAHPDWSAAMVIDRLMTKSVKLNDGRRSLNICYALRGEENCQ